MNRVLELLREQLGRPPGASDRHLLDRFRDERDEVAFAELVRRYAPIVWGVCRRRLANTHDAEDAFQATFLVLVRRASRFDADVPLGPWLHRVAVMTTRNVARGNRRRAAVSGPMEHDVPVHEPGQAIERLDLDAALLALPERYRAAVVLCHLQGLTRREAAAQLGCPEGTLSARLSRALARLRARLGVGFPAILAAGTTTAPAVLSAATVRAAAIYTTSSLTAAGVSPVVAGLTDGVLRMFWMKKLAAGMALAVMIGGGLLAVFATRSDGIARATETPTAEPQAPPKDPEAAAKRIEQQIEDLRKQKELLGAREMELFAEKERLEAAMRAKEAADAAAGLGKDIAVVVENGKPAEYRIYEVINGKVTSVSCTDLDILTTYLKRAFNDPKGPQTLRVGADKGQSYDLLRQVFAACAAAGYKRASFSHDRPTGYYHRYADRLDMLSTYRVFLGEGLKEVTPKAEPTVKPGEIDLRDYIPRK